jgi:hypothetical protein
MQMRKVLLLTIVALFPILFSCSDDDSGKEKTIDKEKTIEDFIKEERNAINRFIDMQDIIILKTYPKDSTFKENEYFQTVDGLYFNVVKNGNGTTLPMYGKCKIQYEYRLDIKSYVSGKDNSITYSNDLYNYSACLGWRIPVEGQYVTEDAVLNLIIPSWLGSKSDFDNFNPAFYKSLKYTDLSQ